MRILLTGATGVIGRRVLPLLAGLDHSVTVNRTRFVFLVPRDTTHHRFCNRIREEHDHDGSMEP
jgi:uncharacterized protein YbjT (DUF2867 family)